jgi:hypothetical protein
LHKVHIPLIQKVGEVGRGDWFGDGNRLIVVMLTELQDFVNGC